MMISRSTIESVGLVDEIGWPSYGWGCDKDYCLRARLAGGSIWVTERAFLNHLGRQTAQTINGYSESDAELENDRGMAAKWGPNWLDRLYDGFSMVPRLGTVQQQLASEE
jgi:GT2 family glycosyltransferase